MAEVYRKSVGTQSKEEIIWYNSQIRVANEPLCSKKAIQNGILYIKDIMNDQGSFLQFEEFCQKSPNTMSWLEYRAMITAIPKEWVNGPDTTNTNKHLHEELCKTKKKASRMYQILLRELEPSLEIMFMRFRNTVEVDLPEYVQAFQNLYRISNITKFRDFQYRLLVNNIFTNDVLYYWKKVPSQQCELCKIEKQTVKHLLFDCSLIQIIWKQLKQYVQNSMEVDINILDFSCKNIFLNTVELHPKAAHVINVLTLVTKQHIFAMKCLERSINFGEVIDKIKKLHNIEKYNACMENRMMTHTAKWAPAVKIVNEPSNQHLELGEFM